MLKHFLDIPATVVETSAEGSSVGGLCLPSVTAGDRCRNTDCAGPAGLALLSLLSCSWYVLWRGERRIREPEASKIARKSTGRATKNSSGLKSSRAAKSMCTGTTGMILWPHQFHCAESNMGTELILRLHKFSRKKANMGTELIL